VDGYPTAINKKSHNAMAPVNKKFILNDAFIGCNRVLCTRIHGYTVALAPIKALPCLCFFAPMAEKPKPPAPRVAW
jgi:hypothetical protein